MSMVKTNLHIHSYLSPCAEDNMNPFDIVGVAKLSGLELIALTDHNSAKNVRAAARAAKEYGIGFIPGIEVNTSEEVHCICLFPDVEQAEAFDSYLEERLPKIKNRPDIFGKQTIMSYDECESDYDGLLIGASSISIDELPSLISDYGGICWPAHVDRDENGLFAVLGFWPEDLDVKACEYHSQIPDGIPDALIKLRASDAHDMETLESFSYELPLKTADFEGLKNYIEGK